MGGNSYYTGVVPTGGNFIREALYAGGRVVDVPSYYSGRGAREGDLPSSTLDAVYDALVVNVNQGAASQFVQMVADITVLSATDFLLALQTFERNGWKWVPDMAPRARGVHADSIGTAFATVMEILGSNGHERQDDTRRIRSRFLHEHAEELREEQKSLAEDVDPFSFMGIRHHQRRRP